MIVWTDIHAICNNSAFDFKTQAVIAAIATKICTHPEILKPNSIFLRGYNELGNN